MHGDFATAQSRKVSQALAPIPPPFTHERGRVIATSEQRYEDLERQLTSTEYTYLSAAPNAEITLK